MRQSYPEHDKLHAIKDQSQAIGAFLDWLQNEREPTIVLCTRTQYKWDNLYQPAHVPIPDLLAEYFEINQDKLEEEKVAMLDKIRKAHEEKVHD